MTKYKYDGEHYRVVVEGITLIKGVAVELSDDNEAVLLHSGFGKAMLDNGELAKLDEANGSEKEPKKPKKSKQAEPPAETDVEPTKTGEPADEQPADESKVDEPAP